MKDSIEMTALACMTGLYLGVLIYLFINRSALFVDLSYHFSSGSFF